ncbi:hypothetical protein SELMODRAFT_441776 [Selaginella moellendorffii]|uniref:Uncharacterized protein n=1 Tax=Selaginella moellendorffii TaxID=88036 RepID=D8RMH7_SELML|nr:hypothetical protein SELMODRAFT_441776 [Selaginella moellendorffii]
MKASVKLREGDQPLLRAKLPLSLLGVPIVSGIALGSSRELSFHLGTLFQTGPSCRITYRPNSGECPLSLLIKSGFGVWGSPTDAPLVMAAEFKLSSKGTPSLAVQVKPRLGNFSLRKTAVSPSPIAQQESIKDSASGQEEPQEGSFLGSSKASVGLGPGSRIEVMPRTPEKISPDLATLSTFKASSPPSSEGSSIVMVEDVEDDHQDDHLKAAAPSIEQGFEDHPVDLHVKTGHLAQAPGNGNWSLVAHTALPLGRHAVASVRWRVKLDSDILESFKNETDIFSFKKLPVLVVDKLSVKSLEDLNRLRTVTTSTLPVLDSDEAIALSGLIREPEPPELGKVAKLCSSMKRELHLLHAENEVLKNTMEDMKAELGSSKRSGKRSPSYMVMDKEMQRQFSSNGNHHRGRDHHQEQHQEQRPASPKSNKSGRRDQELELANKTSGIRAKEL